MEEPISDLEQKVMSGQPTLLFLWKVGRASGLLMMLKLFARIKSKMSLPRLSFDLKIQRVSCPLRSAPIMIFSSGAMTLYGSVPDLLVSATISVAFGTDNAIYFIVSAISGVVSTASTEWSGELALFRISCVSIGLAYRASPDVKEFLHLVHVPNYRNLSQLSEVEEVFARSF
ncbi:hypothetical protein AVEN_187402-1 [Araneus ventricosus]|uniref:Uncharacterized protein n=1 Tax=Araneus ventricosus TaxID=182803 RepID=A0A4Y2N3H8_ARAVE|nr:hypothetical protein AVEN_187402-1 [Araneus ventricosus]